MRISGTATTEKRPLLSPQERVTELIEQQMAVSEVLRAIASSPPIGTTPDGGTSERMYRYVDGSPARRSCSAR